MYAQRRIAIRFAAPLMNDSSARTNLPSEALLIVLGIILVLVGYLLPVPVFIATIGWILVVIGIVLLVLGQVGRPVGGRRYWY